MTETALSLLQSLIRCPSVTPEDAGALDYLQSFLEVAGFTCTRLKFEEVDNLFARYGTTAPHFCFAGHTDVVPTGDPKLWTYPPFGAEVHDGKIYGRGATDMKGSVAAFAVAAAEHVNSMNKGSISFLITGDEEGPAVNGTVKVLQWMKENGHVPDHCLVGEPSSVSQIGDMMKIGRRGSLSFTVTVSGTQGHVAYPEKTDNPVPKLARFVDRISFLELDKGNNSFGPSTLAVTSFDVGNKAGNVVPALATAKFNIRFSTVQTPETLKATITDEIEKVRTELGGVWNMQVSEGADAFVTEPGAFVHLVQKAVQAETGLSPVLSTSGGTSDARFIKDYCPVVEFGPTNASIHQIDEHLSLNELDSVTKIYARILNDYFSASS